MDRLAVTVDSLAVTVGRLAVTADGMKMADG